MDKIKLLESQTKFLFLKKANRDGLLNQLNDDILKMVALIAKEQGISEKELNQWQLDDNAEYFEKKEEKKD